MRAGILLALLGLSGCQIDTPDYVDIDGGADDQADASTIDGGGDDAQPDAEVGCRFRVLFRDGAISDGEIYSANVDGTGITNLSSSPGEDETNARWSPLGDLIVFDSLRDGNSEIYLVNADGTGLDNVSQDASSSDKAPVFSPDGSKIAWIKSGRVWVMDSDGGNREELATLNVLSGQNVSWSPDGSAVAAISTTYDVYAVPLDGSAPTNLTNTPSPASEGQPAWSPLGNKIVYLNANKLWTMNADGSGKQELTPSGSRPTWAPDGASVLYQAVQDGYDEVMTVPVDGGEPMALTDDGPNTYPSWSPDGEFIGYIQSQGSSPVVKYVVTMRPNGTSKETFSVSGNVDNLSWSPCLE